jgi:hypothetical protein
LIYALKKFLKNYNIVTKLRVFLIYKCRNTFNEIEEILGKNYILWDISFLYKNPKYKCLDYLDAIYVNKSIIPEFSKF